MRTKKIRGHKRIHRNIERFKHNILAVNICSYIKKYNRIIITLDIHPWNSLSVTHSIVPQPRGKTKLYMLQTLLDIYDHCHTQLQQLNEPYYCKLWLFEPSFSQSQIVCATGTFINFYETTFVHTLQQRRFPYDNFSVCKQQLMQLSWQPYIDDTDMQLKHNDPAQMEKQTTTVWIGSKV